jgi:hypothetical protein
VVVELLRGDERIGEYTAQGLVLKAGGPASGEPSRPAAPEAPAPAQEGPLRVFLDCTGVGCDYDFFRTEIDFVSHVRDRQDAQVLVLITPQATGGGGTEFTVRFVGRKNFRQIDDSLHYVARPAESEDQVRRALAEVLKRGLVRYVSHTPSADRLRISYATSPQEPGAPVKAHDPWNAWTFGTTLNGSLNSEESVHFISLHASLAANRTTEAWRINTSIQGRYSANRVAVSDTSTVTTVSRDFGADALVVKSLGAHWSLGVQTTLTSSTFLNQSLALRLAPAVEYNVFPYSQATQRQFTIQYSVGANGFDYTQETIFGKTSEALLDQKLLASLAIRQPWGAIATSVEGSFYMHDLNKRHGILATNLDLHLFGGFSLLLLGGLELVRDQLYLSSEGATEEEILLQQRQLATSFRYWSSIGFAYTFGSPFANTVNPRFGGSSGGMPIIR